MSQSYKLKKIIISVAILFVGSGVFFCFVYQNEVAQFFSSNLVFDSNQWKSGDKWLRRRMVKDLLQKKDLLLGKPVDTIEEILGKADFVDGGFISYKLGDSLTGKDVFSIEVQNDKALTVVLHD